MLKFDLTRHILNESLQSSILYDEILNEPSGFFRSYHFTDKNNYGEHDKSGNNIIIRISNNLYKLAMCMNKLTSNINHRFFNISHEYTYNVLKAEANDSGKTPYIINMDDKFLDKVCKEYNKLYDKTLKSLSNLTTRPDVSIIQFALNRIDGFNGSRSDLFNLTDSYFKKHSYTEIKRNGGALPEGDIHFFFNSKKELLFIANNENKIILANYFLCDDLYKGGYTANKHRIKTFDDYKEYIKQLIDEAKRPAHSFTYTSQSGKVYNFPWFENDMNSYYGTAYKFSEQAGEIGEMLSMFAIHRFTYAYSSSKTAGKTLTSKSSNAYKRCHWGENPNDYVISLTLPRNFGENSVNKRDTSLLYKNRSMLKHIRTTAYQDSATQLQYKWKQGILFDTMPYRSCLKQSYTYFDENLGKFITKNIEDYHKDTSFFPSNPDGNRQVYYTTHIDKYSALCRSNNQRRYSIMHEIAKSAGPINQMKQILEMHQNNIKTYTQKIKEVTIPLRKLVIDKATSGQDKLRIRNLIMSESVYDSFSNFDADEIGLQNLFNIYIQEVLYNEKLIDDALKSLTNMYGKINNRDYDYERGIKDIQRMINNIANSNANKIPEYIDSKLHRAEVVIALVNKHNTEAAEQAEASITEQI